MLKVNKFCSCGKLIRADEKCSCKKRVRTDEQRKRHNELNSVRWRKFRKSIAHRDSGHCQRCVIKYGVVNTDNLQIHHVLPRSEYPELMYEPTNCVTLCASCNRKLGTNEELDFDFQPGELPEYVL
ncbi:HNH endonuclease [Halobacillus litoralis]|uniref:HNH endonuclease n=1 Tax=Halobacillus litoralis TaxID=45668 RepID=UPI003D7EBA6B